MERKRGQLGAALSPLDKSAIMEFRGGGLYKTEDHGKHWQHRKVGLPDLCVFGVTVDPVDHSVYATTFGGNSPGKSNDYGETFTRIDRPLPRDRLEHVLGALSLRRSRS